jgi:hypothetical protein
VTAPECVQHVVDCFIASVEAINLMEARKAQGEASLWVGIFDAEWDNQFAHVAGNSNFPMDPWARVDALRKNQEHRTRIHDRVKYLLIERSARPHVARCDPRAHAKSLKFFYKARGQSSIFARMADKQGWARLVAQPSGFLLHITPIPVPL